jgi:hypothetical protein
VATILTFSLHGDGRRPAPQVGLPGEVIVFPGADISMLDRLAKAIETEPAGLAADRAHLPDDNDCA